VGVLGGTFDPIHLGHLDVARAAADALQLAEVRLTPSHVPPHRRTPGASVFHRFAMTSLAAAGDSRFVASDQELLRGGPSFTADTLRALQAEGMPASRLFFLTGADAFAEIATWKDYPVLLDLAHFVVCSRPGSPAGMVRGLLPDLADRMTTVSREDRVAMDDSPEAPTRILLLDAATASVSSTDVRATAAAGASLDGLVPGSVAAHIRKHRLYGSM
jgi:nicotinate-nucleotide adenylyltransferase